MGIKKKHKKEKSSRRFSDPSSSLSPGSSRFLQDDEGRYEGEIEEGNKHGYGIYYSTNGSVYNGQWEKNHPHGYGKKSFPSGDLHEGYYEGGVRNGWGFYLWVCGDKYTGNWKGGLMHGYGYFAWANGDVYSGNWAKGKMSGYGVKTSADGTCEKGEFSEGQLNSWGIKTLLCGDIYRGEFRNGSKHGHGEYQWVSGDLYNGEWKDNRITGKGEMIVSAQRRPTLPATEVVVYRGQFVNELREGYGESEEASGVKYAGEWKNDVRHGWGTLYYPNGDFYQGTFVNGKKQGTGLMTFSAPSAEEILSGLVADEDIGFDLEVHRGQWANDLPQGFGIRNYANGQIYIGNFHAGQRQGQGDLRRLLHSRNDDNHHVEPQGISAMVSSADPIVRSLLLEWDQEDPILQTGTWNNNQLVS